MIHDWSCIECSQLKNCLFCSFFGGGSVGLAAEQDLSSLRMRVIPILVCRQIHAKNVNKMTSCSIIAKKHEIHENMKNFATGSIWTENGVTKHLETILSVGINFYCR